MLEVLHVRSLFLKQILLVIFFIFTYSSLLRLAFPTLVDIRRHLHHGLCRRFTTIREDSEGTLVHLTGRPASLICHRMVRDNSEHCAYASTL